MSGKNLPTGGTQAVSKIKQKDAGGSYGSSALIISKKTGEFQYENTKKNHSGFTAIHNHSGGQLYRLHGKANTDRKYDFGGAV